jgi:transposase
MPICHTSILRQLKANAPKVQDRPHVRVAGIDEWAWRKGTTYGTVIVDLERREVVDLLPDRATASVAKWFSDHPEVEYISRDRAGVYADGARQGAPQARQGADRFHLLMNFRETVAREMNGIGPPIRENILAGSDHELRDQEFEERERVVASARRQDRPLRANTSETIEWLKFTLEGVGERTHGYAFEDTAF